MASNYRQPDHTVNGGYDGYAHDDEKYSHDEKVTEVVAPDASLAPHSDKTSLQRNLGARQITMIALGGALGTGEYIYLHYRLRQQGSLIAWCRTDHWNGCHPRTCWSRFHSNRILGCRLARVHGERKPAPFFFHRHPNRPDISHDLGGSFYQANERLTVFP